MTNKTLVEAVVERVSSQTAVSAGAVEAVLDTLSQMGLLAPSQTSPSPLPDDPAFAMTFRDYLSLSADERRAMTLDLQNRLRDWLTRQMDLHRATWIVVIGGQVVESSPRLDDYPAPERLMKLGTEYNRIPFVFSRPPLFEDWDQSPLCEVNPARLALAGRNLLLRFPLTVELNGAERKTVVTRC